MPRSSWSWIVCSAWVSGEFIARAFHRGRCHPFRRRFHCPDSRPAATASRPSRREAGMAYRAAPLLVVSAAPRCGSPYPSESSGAAMRGVVGAIGGEGADVSRHPLGADRSGGGKVVIVQAALCRAHRNEVALKYPSARGCGQFGDSCNLCEAGNQGGYDKPQRVIVVELHRSLERRQQTASD
jgi:hypothetical protein